ncbi:MAG: hypothetical protein V9H69_15060 [Anaerolineae bacterium]
MIWSRAAANDLARGLLTPLTWSILSYSAEQAVRSHYRAWGVTLPADAPIWRRMEGRAYLNTTVLTAADQAVTEGDVQATSGWRLFSRGPDRRQNIVLRQQMEQAPAVFSAALRWWQQVQTMRWDQATVLQVMEEIEPRAEAVLTTRDFLETGLGAARRQLTRWLAEWLPDSGDAIFDQLFAGLDGREGWAQYRYDWQRLTEGARQNAAVVAYLADRSWQTPAQSGNAPTPDQVVQSLPDGAFRRSVAAFVADYARWADQPLEIASPRWAEAPQTLLTRLAARLAEPPEAPLPSPAAAQQRRAEAGRAVVAQVGAKRRRQFEPVFDQLQQIVALMPASREALVTVMAAARYWALGAAQEAAHDDRLTAAEDVFLLELEELKQIMTGEWHDPEQVQPLADQRRAEQAAWAMLEPAEVVEG